MKKKLLNIIIGIVILIISIGVCLLLKNNLLLFVLPLFNILVYISCLYLKYYCHINLDKDKINSLLNFDVEKNRIKIYLCEALIFSGIYTFIESLCEIFNVKFLIFKLKLLLNVKYNQLLLFLIVYLIIFILTIIVEYVFVEKKIKKDKRVKNERRK